MGSRLYVVVDRAVVGCDATTVDGKALARAVYRWDVPALSVLSALCSADPHDEAHMLGYFLPDEADPDPEYTRAPPDFPFLPEEWHEAAAGLRAVRGALESLADGSAPATSSETAAVRRELLAVETILARAAAAGARFHFAMDV